MIKKLSFLVSIVMAASLTGCATAPPPPVNYSLSNVGVSKIKHDAELKSINVSYANKGETTGIIPATATRTPDLWKNSLEGALNNMVIFKDDATKKVNLMVKITRFEPAQPGVDMTAYAEARYDIVDRNNGDIIFSQSFSSSGKQLFNENLNGIARIIEATNMAVRNNITAFLQSLEEVNINKPMFPVGK